MGVGHVFARGAVLWLAFAGPSGARCRVSTGIRVGRGARQREAALLRAERLLEERLRLVAAQLESAKTAPITVAQYAEEWLGRRTERGVATVNDDRARLRDHVLPVIGAVPLKDVRPRDIRTLFSGMESRSRLAPKTVHNVYGVVHCLFADAVAEELREANPCVLTARRGELPDRVDRDPNWRAGAIYSKGEARQLCLDHRIPEVRRILYSMLFFGGMRIGEVLARRWRDYDPAREPLGALEVHSAFNSRNKLVGATKTRRPRTLPVHPALARVLAEWRLLGWEEYVGRRPAEDDFIIPPPTGRARPKSCKRVLKALRGDCARLGIRPRRTHDSRRSFITWCRAGGALDPLLRWVTHGPGKKTILDAYTTPPWQSLSAQVLTLGLDLRSSEVVLAASSQQHNRRGT